MNNTLESEFQSRYDVDLYDIFIVLFSLENKDHHGQHSCLLWYFANVLLPFPWIVFISFLQEVCTYH